jgi:photosystem II stability/assembly factor-like uncharacterized protein
MEGGALIIHPDSADIVITAGDDSTTSTPRPAMVCFSGDGGSTWERCNLSDTSNGAVYAIAAAPGAPNILYGAGHVNYSGRVWRSTDYGRTWTMTPTAPSGRVYGLAIHPDDPGVAYAAALDSCWKTTDAGQTWRRIGGGYYLSDVCLFPRQPDTVIVAGRYGVALTTNAGQTWQPMSTGLGVTAVTCLEAVEDNAETRLYAGTGGAGVYVYSFLTGVWEKAEHGARTARTTHPSIARDVLFIRGLPSRQAGLSMLDPTGRKVMDLQVGENDIRGIAPGVYFLRGAATAGLDAVAVHKLVVQ